MEGGEKERAIMPPVSPEIMLLLDNITKQIQHNADLQESQRVFVQAQIDAINILIKQSDEKTQIYLHTYVEDRVKSMDKDIVELKKQLDDVKQAILEKQEESYKTMIRVQASIILLVVGAIITVLTKVIFHV